VNTGDLWPDADTARRRVLKIQTKLHQWASDDSDRRFDDLFNLVCDPAVLVDAWQRVLGNRGARSAGVDGQIAYYIRAIRGEQAFLSELRDQLKARSFRPDPVREVMIPKPGGRRRPARHRDRAGPGGAGSPVLEPVFEADFKPCSYGFRPRRRAQDAVAEIHYLTSRSYEWVLEGDIAACFDEISHSALLQRVRARIGDKRVLDLVKAFLKSDILGEDRELRESHTGAPQGGILSPLLSNIALSILDEHFAEAWQSMGDSHAREYRRRKGLANYRIVRFADDFVVLVAGDRSDAEQLRDEAARVLLPMGLRLSREKTLIAHIDEGFVFLGMRIQRHKKRGAARRYVYTYPSRAALAAVKAKVRTATRGTTNQSLSELLHHLNQVLRGWTNYHRHGAASATFSYLTAFTWRRVWIWLRHKHPKATANALRRRYLRRWHPEQDGVRLFYPETVAIVRYRYRGTAIPSPWSTKESAA
jgi:RNA-directed DNA polymerase